MEYTLEMIKSQDHIAIQPDGNRRWAIKHNIPLNEVYAQGMGINLKIAKYCDELNIKYLTIQLFCYQSFERKSDDVNTLINGCELFSNNISNYIKPNILNYIRKNIKIRFVGEIERVKSYLPIEFLNFINDIEYETQNNKGLILTFYIGTGSVEMIDAIKEITNDISKGILDIKDINNNVIYNKLYTKDIPPPNIFIGTELKNWTSNFMMWQLQHTRIYSAPVVWPEFKKKHLLDILNKDVNNINYIENKYGYY